MEAIREMIIKFTKSKRMSRSGMGTKSRKNGTNNEIRNEERDVGVHVCNNELVLACQPRNGKTCSIYKFWTWLNVAAAAYIWNYDTIVAHWKFIDAVVLHPSYHNKFIINAETFWRLKMHYATASLAVHRSCITRCLSHKMCMPTRWKI